MEICNLQRMFKKTKDMKKIHKFYLQIDYKQWSHCNLIKPNYLSLKENKQFASYWENVTCKKCLKKRKK